MIDSNNANDNAVEALEVDNNGETNNPLEQDVESDAAKAPAQDEPVEIPLNDKGEETPAQSTGCGKKRMAIAIAAGIVVLLVCIGVGVGVGVGLTRGNDKQKQVAVQESTPQNNTSSLRPSLSQVIDFLAATGVSSKEDLQQGGTPQSLAANWMANLDGMNYTLPTVTNQTSAKTYQYMTRYVLAVLWYAMDGINWMNQFGFLSVTDFCYWNAPIPVTTETGVVFQAGGIYCDRKTRKIVAVHLDYNKLSGNVPSELAKLTSLSILSMSGNKLMNGLTETICDLEALSSLTMSSSGLTGTIPSCLSTMTDLKVLLLSNNNLTGRLPDFFKLLKLVTIFLDDNKLTGTITSTFNSMTNLTYLFLQSNFFHGTVDDRFLKNATKLKRIDASNCRLTGQLPSHFLQMPKLDMIDLHGNRLSGTLPTVIYRNTALQFLALQDNLIEGQISPDLANLTKLFHLDLSSNALTGPIPGRIGMLPLSYLFLANNTFVEGPIPSTISTMTDLKELSLKGTSRNGTIPAWIGTKLTNLQLLDLDNNKLSGSIPSELGRLSRLEFLLLNRNLGVTGTMPTQFNKLSSLRAVFLDSTSISGSLEPICNLPSLNKPANSGKLTRDYVVADCGGSSPNVACACCTLCCSDADPFCNMNVRVPSVNPEWEDSFMRVEYNFGTNATVFKEKRALP
ncbi:hypothetical protein MPSEU_000301500 [Mayamaea pseudoterrestris]|nr:hypothetical protein MPSEU_000301500 [Mayamaea pseudoterrestris]